MFFLLSILLTIAVSIATTDINKVRIKLILVVIDIVPIYLPYAVRQVFLFNPNIDVEIVYSHLLESRVNELRGIVDGFVKENFSVNLFDADTIESKLVNNALYMRDTNVPVPISKCELCHNINEVVYNIHGINVYWTNTIKRFLTLYYYFHSHPHVHGVFHMESDIMIYGDLSKLRSTIHSCHGDISYPRNIGSLMFFKDKDAIEYMLRNFLDNLHKLNSDVKIKKMDSFCANDMELLSRFKVDHESAQKRSKRSSKGKKSFNLLELPYNPNDGSRHCIFKQDGSFLYDPHFVGQLLGGITDHSWVPFDNPYTDGFHPNITDFIWEKDEAERWLVKYHNITIFNLHIHSKQLNAFMSNRLEGDLPYPDEVKMKYFGNLSVVKKNKNSADK